jgi:hypothetical protein
LGWAYPNILSILYIFSMSVRHWNTSFPMHKPSVQPWAVKDTKYFWYISVNSQPFLVEFCVVGMSQSSLQFVHFYIFFRPLWGTGTLLLTSFLTHTPSVKLNCLQIKLRNNRKRSVHSI